MCSPSSPRPSTGVPLPSDPGPSGGKHRRGLARRCRRGDAHAHRARPALRDSRPRTRTAAIARQHRHAELGEGPCSVAYAGGSRSPCPHLHDDDRLPDRQHVDRSPRDQRALLVPLRHWTEPSSERWTSTADIRVHSASAQLAVAQTFAQPLPRPTQGRADARASRACTQVVHADVGGLTEPNRLLLERLVAAMNRCRRTGSQVALMYLDLDTFKAVNDTFGHRVGDEVLTIVAQRLTALVRPGDTVARLGGDEFAVLCDDIADESDLAPIANRVNDAFQQPFDVTTGPVEVRASSVSASGTGRRRLPSASSKAQTPPCTRRRDMVGATHCSAPQSASSTERTSALPRPTCADGSTGGVVTRGRWPLSPLSWSAAVRRGPRGR
jgi:diguanylate cyclase (GGDEF)-like protein